MGTYEQGRDRQHLASLYAAIDDFITRYNANPSTERRRTIFLFPGGMGSQLMRATTDSSGGPSFFYDVIWLNCSSLTGAATKLRMQGSVDYQKHYILPHGCVDFLTLRPYEDFTRWCENNALDLFVFGWDWRRDLTDTVRFFLDTFLPAFERRTDQCRPKPLDDFTLVGHSFGGLVVKLILNESSNKYVRKMRRAMTVGSPLYGYGGQVHRYFKGDPDFNRFYRPTTVTEIISTCPGGYELMFLDEETFDANKTAFEHDPGGYDLKCYPSLDASSGERADPYNPVPGQPRRRKAGLVRYISNHKFDWQLLKAALPVRKRVASKLSNTVAAKFHNIRGVQFANGADVAGTVVSQAWRLVPPTFDPARDTDPLVDHAGPGDAVIPAWSARLVSLPDDQVITVRLKGDDEHMTMMNSSPVQTAIWKLLGFRVTAMKRLRAPTTMPAATRADLNKFLDGLDALSLVDQPPTQRTDLLRDYLQKFPPGRLQQFLNRAYLDLLKSPSQKNGPSPRPGRRKTARKPKRSTKRR